jgi:hypothetical protein
MCLCLTNLCPFGISATAQSRFSSGAVCKPVVQISRYHLNFWSDALRLDVSPCAIAALQQDGDITLQTDNSIGSINIRRCHNPGCQAYKQPYRLGSKKADGPYRMENVDWI